MLGVGGTVRVDGDDDGEGVGLVVAEIVGVVVEPGSAELQAARRHTDAASTDHRALRIRTTVPRRAVTAAMKLGIAGYSWGPELV